MRHRRDAVSVSTGARPRPLRQPFRYSPRAQNPSSPYRPSAQNPSAGAGADLRRQIQWSEPSWWTSRCARSPASLQRRLGTLPLGSRSLVVGAPREGHGYLWIQIAGTLAPARQRLCDLLGDLAPHAPPVLGWAATGDPASGTKWFGDDPSACAVSGGGCARIHDARGR